MVPPTEQELRNKVWATFIQSKGFTSDELNFLRSNIKLLAEHSDQTHAVAQTRVSIELLDSIRRFDEASGKMVKRGNRINTLVLVFAIVAALLAGGSLWLSYLALIKG
jgi:hypothetical protein